MACQIENTLCKSSTAVLDYGFDWADWLVSETISTSTWSVPSGITKDSDSNTTTTSTIWLSGGTLGNVYTITNTIATSASRTDTRAFLIQLGTR